MSATRTAPQAPATTNAAPAAAPATPQPSPAKAAAPARKPAAKAAAAKKAPVAAKPAAAPKAAKAAPAVVKEAKDAKAKKPKLVRDSFTIPKDEYAAIDALKLRTGKLAQTAKKSELLRAGLKLLGSLDDAALAQALQAVPSIKTGRPKAEDQAAAPAAKQAKAAKAPRK